jgi:hypothetical protein
MEICEKVSMTLLEGVLRSRRVVVVVALCMVPLMPDK